MSYLSSPNGPTGWFRILTFEHMPCSRRPRRLTLEALGHENGVDRAVVIALQNLDPLEAVLVIKGQRGMIVDRHFQHHHERGHLAQALAGGSNQLSTEAMAASLGMHVDGNDVAVSLALVMEG